MIISKTRLFNDRVHRHDYTFEKLHNYWSSARNHPDLMNCNVLIGATTPPHSHPCMCYALGELDSDPFVGLFASE
jgi:hypothetical protein